MPGLRGCRRIVRKMCGKCFGGMRQDMTACKELIHRNLSGLQTCYANVKGVRFIGNGVELQLPAVSL
jgi:hypothetical protein